jgi:hypothetical protein
LASLKLGAGVAPLSNVPGELVKISVVAASWFCESPVELGKVEDVKPVLLKLKKIKNKK